MVRSLLDKSVEYPELTGIDDEDENYDAPAYEVTIDGIVVEVSLGKPKYAFVEKSIVYFPAYLVFEDKVVRQIGLYEVLEENLPNVMDEEGDLDLTKTNDILRYKDVTGEMLEEYASVLDEDIAGIDKKEVSEGKQSMKRGYNEEDSKYWIQRYFKDNRFAIVDNEGGGDCLFLAIRDGLATIGKSMTVIEMRDRLSKEATPQQFQLYRELYESQYNQLKEVEARIKQYLEESKQLKARAKDAKTREEKALILKEAKAVADAHKYAKEEKAVAKEMLDEYKWMAKIDSFPKFIKAIRTCSFWADSWAISTLERILNIKLIILSDNAYDEGDIADIIQCGESDPELQKQGLFRPADYVIVSYTGNHYKLVTYDGKGAFTYNDLPREIVKLVRDKCLERMAGLFAMIPEFNEGLEIPEEEVEEPEDLMLHSDLTVFQFYEKAAAKPLPGKGTGEKIGPEGDGAYKTLRGEWRKMLSRGFDSQFKLDGHMWKSVEHYIQANKFKKTSPEFYLQFTLESGSELSKDADMAKAAGAGKKYNGKVVRPKGVVVDPEWDESIERQVTEIAQRAKFENKELREVLKKTGDAKLLHYMKGQPPRVEVELMKVRKSLQ